MAGSRYEYSYIDSLGAATAFGLFGVGDDVANAVGFALQNLPTINTVVVKRFTESSEDVTASVDDPATAGAASLASGTRTKTGPRAPGAK